MAVDEHEIRSGTLEELAQTVTQAEKEEAIHAVRSAPEVTFTWDYERSRPQLSKLYEKAKTSQWNANDLPWDTVVDQVAVIEANRQQNANIFEGHDVRARTFGRNIVRR